MVITLSDGRTYKVAFIHSSADFGLDKHGNVKQSGPTRLAIDAVARDAGRRLTACEIAEVGYTSTEGRTEETYHLRGQGVAICHPKDNFDKSKGRKASFTKALLASGFNVAQREQFWAAYVDEFVHKPRFVIVEDPLGLLDRSQTYTVESAL